MEQGSMFKGLYGFSKDEFLQPSYYDSETKEIKGAKEGSLVWWHEKGHMEYEKNPKTANKDYTRQSMWKCAVFFAVLAFFVDILKYFALMFLFTNIYYALSEEIWCWVYAIKKHKKQELKKPRPEVLKWLD
jgi:hypothetical protein